MSTTEQEVAPKRFISFGRKGKWLHDAVMRHPLGGPRRFSLFVRNALEFYLKNHDQKINSNERVISYRLKDTSEDLCTERVVGVVPMKGTHLRVFGIRYYVYRVEERNNSNRFIVTLKHHRDFKPFKPGIPARRNPGVPQKAPGAEDIDWDSL